MKLPRILSKLLAPIPALVVPALAAMSASSRAATITAGNSDLFLAFRETASSTAYIVKIGTVSQYNAGGAFATGSTQLSLGNIGTDLQNTFGLSWFSSSDVSWGVFGFSNVSNPSLYSSVARTSPGTTAAGFNGPTTLEDRQGTQGNIGNVVSWVNGKTSTANSNVGVVQSGVSGLASYYNEVSVQGSSDFGTTSNWTSIEGSFGGGSANAVLDLYRYPNDIVFGGTGAITNLGKFTITDAGAVTFTAAVPEPSSLGLLAVVGAGLAGFYRRRQQLVAA
jgi:hypothetical protein